MVVAVEGLTLVVSVPVDLGDFVPTARLQSNLTQLMRKLITRIEELGDNPNPAGERIRGAEPVTGAPAVVSAKGLNSGQREAVASVLGRDTTFIWGPPGTGKTRTIGAIGDELFATRRSLLVVSHTNTAVDQALVKIGEALRHSAPDALEAGKVLRVGEPADQRLRDWPELLCSTHVERRSAELTERREGLVVERDELVHQALALSCRIDMCEWVRDAAADLDAMDGELAAVRQLDADLAVTQERRTRLAEDAHRWRAAGEAAHEAQRQQRTLAQLDLRLAGLQTDHAEATVEAAHASHQLSEAEALLERAQALEADRRRADELPDLEAQRLRASAAASAYEAAAAALAEEQERLDAAEEILADTASVGGLTRRWRGLPGPEEQNKLVEACRVAAEQAASVAEGVAGQARAEASVLSEVEGAAARLAPYTAVPRLAPQTAATDAAAKANQAATRRVDALAVAVADTSGQAVSLRAALKEFTDTHGAHPAGVLADADAHVRELAEVTALASELGQEATTRRRDLESLLRDRLGALREWELTREAPGPAESMLAAIREAHAAARAALAGVDVAALRSERNGVNERIRSVDAEIGEIDEALKRVEELVIADAAVVATTLTRAYLRDSIQRRRFDTVILDEASMAPIPALWVAASLADANVVAVGDFRQLPPIVQARHDLAQKWLGRDIFEAHGITDHRGAPAHFVTLSEQFRMHPDISAIVNALVYDKLLRDADEVETAPLPDWYNRRWAHDSPVLLVDTGSTGAWVTSVARGDTASRLNFLSATICVDVAEQLLSPEREPLEVGAPPRVLVVCPYRPHAKLLELLLREQGLEGEVRAGTAHTFQGSEADVVILDLVNDEPHWRVGCSTPSRTIPPAASSTWPSPGPAAASWSSATSTTWPPRPGGRSSEPSSSPCCVSATRSSTPSTSSPPGSPDGQPPPRSDSLAGRSNRTRTGWWSPRTTSSPTFPTTLQKPAAGWFSSRRS